MPELWGPSNERIWRFLGLDGDDAWDWKPPRLGPGRKMWRRITRGKGAHPSRH